MYVPQGFQSIAKLVLHRYRLPCERSTRFVSLELLPKAGLHLCQGRFVFLAEIAALSWIGDQVVKQTSPRSSSQISL